MTTLSPQHGGGGKNLMTQLCEAWRAGAPDTVTAQINRVFHTDHASALASMSSAHTTRSSSSRDGTGDDDVRLLLTSRHEALYNAFALEISAVAPSAASLAVGLFAVSSRACAPTSHLAKLAGLRAVITPLCAAPTAEALLERVAHTLAVRIPHAPDTDAVPVALFYDCVARHPARCVVSFAKTHVLSLPRLDPCHRH